MYHHHRTATALRLPIPAPSILRACRRVAICAAAAAACVRSKTLWNQDDGGAQIELQIHDELFGEGRLEVLLGGLLGCLELLGSRPFEMCEGGAVVVAAAAMAVVGVAVEVEAEEEAEEEEEEEEEGEEVEEEVVA